MKVIAHRGISIKEDGLVQHTTWNDEKNSIEDQIIHTEKYIFYIRKSCWKISALKLLPGMQRKMYMVWGKYSFKNWNLPGT